MKNMNGIIKTVKTSNYLQVHNEPVQNTLKDLKSIGLLTYLMSLPEGWEIRKMQLFEKYGRGPVNTALKEMVETRHFFTIKFRDGKKDGYFYQASDIPFSDEQINEAIEQMPFPITEVIASNFHCRFSTSEQERDEINDFSIVDFEQSKMDNPKQATIKEIDTKEINKKEILNKDKDFVNKESVNKIENNNEIDEIKKNEIIHKLTNEYRLKGLSKEVCVRLVNELKENKEIKNYGAYLRGSLEKSLYSSQLKKGQIDINPIFDGATERNGFQLYNWLEIRE